ncbi:hypothetical protein [Chryseobacterium sp. CT-SW4]|uniref:hypothetical protein n=1 Tax=Chryseobacterium sp. SW-1 TaxID=3157343 RepID=UPI003B01AA6C
MRKHRFNLNSNFSGPDNIQNFPLDTIRISGVLSKDLKKLYQSEENSSFSISTSDLKFSVLDGSEPSSLYFYDQSAISKSNYSSVSKTRELDQIAVFIRQSKREDAWEKYNSYDNGMFIAPEKYNPNKQ